MHCVNCGIMPCEGDYFCEPCLESMPDHLKAAVPMFREIMADGVKSGEGPVAIVTSQKAIDFLKANRKRPMQ